MSNWITTVDELVRIFRDALVAVAPVLERAGIRSDESHAYDDWDAIAQALFKNIVVRSIQWSNEASRDIDLGPYATVGVGRSVARILVRDKSGVERGLFHAIVTRQRPFDSVKMLDASGEAVTGEMGFDSARFALRIPGHGGSVEKLTVDL